MPKRNEPQREVQAWDKGQVEAFLTSEATQASPLLTLFEAAFHLGARKSELLQLTRDDVDLVLQP